MGEPPCPICGKPASPRLHPFCSARCSDVDLGRWFTGRYAVATEEAEQKQGEGAALDPRGHPA